jgi:hypothetical protein
MRAYGAISPHTVGSRGKRVATPRLSALKSLHTVYLPIPERKQVVIVLVGPRYP